MGKSFLDHCNEVASRHSVNDGLIRKARDIAAERGEAFIVWVGSNVAQVFSDVSSARNSARSYAKGAAMKGLRDEVRIRRVKV